MGAPGNTPGETNASQVTVPCIVFFALTPIFIAIRLWARLGRGSFIGADDYTILVSFACMLAVQILMMISVYYGFGQHVYNLAAVNRLEALKLFYVAQIFYKVTINLTKTSILLLYLRIFVQRWFRICSYVLMGFILSYMVATTASSIFQCNPIRGAWDKSMKPQCIDITINWYANAGFSIATDILILLLPMQPLWASKLPVNQKIALMLVFALGGVVTVTSIMRSTTLSFSTKTPDITYDITSTLWTMVEQNLAIISACLPMCRMPLAWLLPAVFRGASKTGSNYQYGSRQPGNQGSGQQSANWHPHSGASKTVVVTRSIVHHSEETSEEYILESVKRHEMKQDMEGDNGAIRKTTQYEVAYDQRV